ncbi:NF041680 family putative transposase [Cyanobacterium aponinum UTEX 3222]|uniref:NF041680 family putative transposase n=1 Tax=Cyanobacterium aponinum TaxID=379064 RepID=UPI002B4BF06D|nr:NF041680 family putative transposase [Cyanobacterium aponinum]WRL40226.1 NF041680 family putative transposase [Cyanobacterium aponinum UTEX 3221]WRL43128.1 NF041680 family putative transposase [Cyanobacterium aponinum UTEX 3222]
MNKYNRLKNFCHDTYEMLVKSKDATFELMDSIMTRENARSLAEFSLSPFFQRQWCSTYEAIEDSRPNGNKLMKRYTQEIDTLEYTLLGIDHTQWECKDSPTMKDRGYQYSHSSLNSSVVGQGYSTIAWLPPLKEKGSWALPLRHERITSFETPLSKARWQLKQVCRELPENRRKLVVLDCEYGNGKFIQQTADIEISKLIRVRSNLCLYSKPDPYSGRGRPKKHGAKWKLNQCDDFPQSNKVLEMEDSSLGLIRISKWTELHFYNAPTQQLTLFKIERLKEKKTGSLHRPLWLIWVGEEFLSLEYIWSQYKRRFGLEHWYRFAKQRLHWTLPNFRTPDRCQRWSNLIVNITWQLWLSKDLVQEHHLPWQKPQQNLTPGRVALSMTSLLIEIGSPTLSPKSRGKSHGWPQGRKRNKAKVYPTIKKQQSKSKKRRKT